MNAKKNKHKRTKINLVKESENEKCDSEVKITEPVQTVTETVKTENAITEAVQTVTETVKTENAPENVPKVIEVRDIENEPAKPKRNKNKKKKQEESNQDLETEIVEPTQAEINVSVNVESNILEKVSDKESDTFVTATARKKKNKKNKAIEDKQEITKEIEPAPQGLSEVIEPVTPQELDTEVKELIEPEPKEGKKKKNKKKKRNDSEKSDKNEEVKLCTSAFQKLLADEKIESQDKVITETENAENIPEKVMKDVPEKVKDKVTDNKPTEIKQTAVVIKEETKELPKDEAPSKKKNKKDRKHLQKEQQDSQEQVQSPVKVTEEPANETVTEKVESPKSKAKIAKPVEKKRKPLPEDEPIEPEGNKEQVIIPEVIEKESLDTKPIQESELITDIVEPIILEASDTKKDNISVPDNSRKKRKKSPKPKSEYKDIDKNPIIQEQVSENIIEQNVSQIETTNIPSEECAEPVCDESTASVTHESLLQEETKPEKTEIKIEPEKIVKGKKKKKPKTPEPTEIKPETSKQPETPKTPELKLESEKLEEPETHKTPELKLETPITEEKDIDIEVRSLRADESEGSSYDITPDVHFQRSSSQQLLDDNNNNMVIREISSSDDLKVFESNLIVGSGETPILTPDVIPSGVKTEDSGLKIEEIKQDKETVKSKMMQVNKDMEELKLSIEKSLAEFSAIEKSEDEIEKKFEESQKAQENIPLESKLSESIELMETASITPALEESLQEKPTETSVIKETTSKAAESLKTEKSCETEFKTEQCPPRKDKKGKSKKKGKQETSPTTLSTTASTTAPTAASTTASTTASTAGSTTDTTTATTTAPTTATTTATTTASTASTTASTASTTAASSQESTASKGQQSKKGSKQTKSNENKGKQKSDGIDQENNKAEDENATENLKSDTFSDSLELDYEPIENFEGALTSSNDDVNITFEMIANDADSENKRIQKELADNKPHISVTAPEEGTNKNVKNPVSPPKNLLGHTNIPVQSNRVDYKKEKNKTPNEIHAKVKIKDTEKFISKESQTENKKIIKKGPSDKDSFSQIVKDNGEYVYKYSFRKVFLQSACHICKKSLLQSRVPCSYCNLVFYCSNKHKDEDYAEHQALCFAVSTIVHLKDQKHIYADAKNVIGQDYRILRMQIIVSCEKVLKRRLVPWEQEALLYPRVCSEVSCREWRQAKLKDCEGCGQLSYCADQPEHLPKTHHKWCKSYSLYAKLVCYQQTKGRLDPKLPTRVMMKYEMSGKLNEVLASMYEEKIDMNDIQYAALTQIATAPLTAVYCYQLYLTKKNLPTVTNGSYKHPFVIHVVGAELQFEADALNKWEIFFLHLRPDVEQLKVVLISPALNPGNLPLDLLGKIRSCENCINNKRGVTFSFQDKSYLEYRNGEDFINPDLVCAYNPSIQRSSAFNIKDPWPTTINAILKIKKPFIITGYTIPELRKDIAKIKEFSELDFNVITEPILNNFASVRPDRNFITDDEMPLLFKNYCLSVICGC